MIIHIEGKSCSDLGRVLVLNDPPVRKRARQTRLAEMRGASYRGWIELDKQNPAKDPIGAGAIPGDRDSEV